MFKIVDIMSDDNGCRNVVIHEIMHIIQMGCACENIEHCTRRCGISYRWDNFEYNTSDFGWLFEGSAERSMCNLTGDKLFTYEYMINYVCSLNLVSLLRESIPANYAETISFYNDANKLFEMFGCKNREEINEILNMMIAINIIQMKPEELLEAYGEEKNVNIADQAIIDDLNCTLKPAIAKVFTKQFYINLINALANKSEITTNDICYLIAIFEATLNNHIKYSNEKYDNYNNDFIIWYKQLRHDIFEKIKEDSGVDIAILYKDYFIFQDEENRIVNASLKWNDTEKNNFLLERTDYLEFTIKTKIE